MANDLLDRRKPLLLLLGSLAVGAIVLCLVVFYPTVKSIEKLRAEADAKSIQLADSLRLWEEMSNQKDQTTRAWDEILARFDARVPARPDQERFMAELTTLAVQHQLRELRLSVPDEKIGSPVVATADGSGAEATPSSGTSGEVAPTPRPPPLSEIRYRILFTSAYRDLADLLDSLPRMNRLVALRNLTIREKEGKMETAIELSIFDRGAP